MTKIQTAKQLTKSYTVRASTIGVSVITAIAASPETVQSILVGYGLAPEFADSLVKTCLFGTSILTVAGVSKGRLEAENKPSLEER